MLASPLNVNNSNGGHHCQQSYRGCLRFRHLISKWQFLIIIENLSSPLLVGSFHENCLALILSNVAEIDKLYVCYLIMIKVALICGLERSVAHQKHPVDIKSHVSIQLFPPSAQRWLRSNSQVTEFDLRIRYFANALTDIIR